MLEENNLAPNQTRCEILDFGSPWIICNQLTNLTNLKCVNWKIRDEKAYELRVPGDRARGDEPELKRTVFASCGDLRAVGAGSEGC